MEDMTGWQIVKNGRVEFTLDTITKKTIDSAIGFLECQQDMNKKSEIEERQAPVDVGTTTEEKAEDIGALQKLPQQIDADAVKPQGLADAPRPQAAKAKGEKLTPVVNAATRERNVAAVQSPALTNHGKGMIVYLQNCSGFTIGGDSCNTPQK